MDYIADVFTHVDVFVNSFCKLVGLHSPCFDTCLCFRQLFLQIRCCFSGQRPSISVSRQTENNGKGEYVNNEFAKWSDENISMYQNIGYAIHLQHMFKQTMKNRTSKTYLMVSLQFWSGIMTSSIHQKKSVIFKCFMISRRQQHAFVF